MDDKKLSFEEAYKQLTELVKKMESGELPLADSVAAYEQGSYNNADTRRDRKLLLHKRQIARLLGKIKEKGYALVPLKVYLKNSLVKVELGLGKGKKSYDKKQTVRERDIRRSAERDIAAMKKAGRIR